MASDDEGLQSVESDVPHLLVLLLQQEDDTGGLSVERAGHVENGVPNNALDGIIGDRALGLKAVVGAARLNQLQKRGSGLVLEFRLSGAHCVDVIGVDCCQLKRYLEKKNENQGILYTILRINREIEIYFYPCLVERHRCGISPSVANQKAPLSGCTELTGAEDFVSGTVKEFDRKGLEISSTGNSGLLICIINLLPSITSAEERNPSVLF